METLSACEEKKNVAMVSLPRPSIRRLWDRTTLPVDLTLHRTAVLFQLPGLEKNAMGCSFRCIPLQRETPKDTEPWGVPSNWQGKKQTNKTGSLREELSPSPQVFFQPSMSAYTAFCVLSQ